MSTKSFSNYSEFINNFNFKELKEIKDRVD